MSLSDPIFNMMCRREPFYIVSHERSGTHLVLNLCYRNLYIKQQFVDLPEWRAETAAGQSQEHYWSRFDGKNGVSAWKGGLIKSHCSAEIWQRFLPGFPAVYVLRDPRDTLVSFFHYLNREEFHTNNPGLEELRCASFSEFLRRPLHPFLVNGFSLNENSTNVVMRWARHARGWLDAPGVLVIHYEEILRSFRWPLIRVARHVKALPKLGMRPYRLGEGGAILPRKGIAGDWVNHFTPDDMAFVSEELGKCHLNLSEWD